MPESALPLQTVGKFIIRVEERILAGIIKQRILIRTGRSIIGPVLPRLGVNGKSKRYGSQEKRGHITCVSCGCEINLVRGVFFYHDSPNKCSACRATVGIKMKNGILDTPMHNKPFFDSSNEHSSQRSMMSQENKRA